MSYEIEQEWSCIPKWFFDFGFALVDFLILLDKFNDIVNTLSCFEEEARLRVSYALSNRVASHQAAS